MTRFVNCLKYTIFFVLALTSGGAAAQSDDYVPRHIAFQPEVDANMLELTERPIADTRKMEIYKKLTDIYQHFNHDSCAHYARRAIAYATRLKEYNLLFDIYSTAGVSYVFNSDYDSASIYFNRMMEIGVERNDKKMQTNALMMFAYNYSKQGKYNSAIEYYLKVLAITEKESWTLGSVGTLINLSELNRRLGNFETAFQQLKQAEELCNTLDYHGGYLWNIVHIYNEYAYNYINQGDYETALRYALKSDSINPGFQVNLCYSHGLLATLYLHFKDYELALQHAYRSFEVAAELNDKNLYANAGAILSDVYLAMHRYAEAEAAALRVWQADSTFIDESRDAVRNIVMANIYMQQTERAAYFLRKYSELNAQYAQKSFQTLLSDMFVKYDTEKKEIRIATLERERRLYTGLGVAGGLLAIALGVVMWQKQRNARKERQLIAARSILDGEMKERSRLAQDLHDRLSGNLSALKIEIAKQNEAQQKINEMLDKCIIDIRDTAHNLMPVSLQRGLKVALEDFAVKFPNVSFHFFGTEERIAERLEYIIYCCACELLNNSVRHSNAESINLQLIQDGKFVTLTVSDNGCGFDEQNIEKGLGLQSVRNRVVSCNGKIDVVSSSENGTETTIELRITE